MRRLLCVPRFVLKQTIVLQLIGLSIILIWFHILFEHKTASVFDTIKHKKLQSTVETFPESHQLMIKEDFLRLQTPSDLFAWWQVQDHRETPGGTLIDLLSKYLHVAYGAEATRRQTCVKKRNLPICFAGVSDTTDACIHSITDKQEQEKCATIPVWTRHEKLPLNAFRIQRLSDPRAMLHDRYIMALATEAVCLPLILAGSALSNHGVAVELGTFVGFSSRCLGVGLNATGLEHRYYGFDTFDGIRNYRKIRDRMRWVKKYNPEYTEDNDSFFFLWKLVMNDVYPTAKGTAGFIDHISLNPSVLGHKPISIVSVDSAKNHRQWMQQMKGILTLTKGTILILMDFTYVTSAVKAVYGCYRQFLFPVYSSFCRGEHMIFVVTETFHLEESFQTCLSHLGKDMDGKLPSEIHLERMRRQMEVDARFLDRLFLEDARTEAVDEQEQCLIDTMQNALVKNIPDWTGFLEFYSNDQNAQ